jgi:hypothetical protein
MFALWPLDQYEELSEQLWGAMWDEYPIDLFVAEILPIVFGFVTLFALSAMMPLNGSGSLALIMLWTGGFLSRYANIQASFRVDPKKESRHLWIVVYGWLRRGVSLFLGAILGLAFGWLAPYAANLPIPGAGFAPLALPVVLGMIVRKGGAMAPTSLRTMMNSPANRVMGWIATALILIALTTLNPGGWGLFAAQLVVSAIAAGMGLAAGKPGEGRPARVRNAAISGAIALAYWLVPLFL